MKLRLTFSLLVLWNITYSQVDPVSKEGVAIAGYDVVSYFLSNKPAKGDAKFKSQYGGVTYYFSSIDNQKLFEANPLKYVPQYDGYCALAVSYGQKISINPETYKITNDKLYLFFNGKTSNGKVNSLDTWNKNEEKYFNKAEKWWPDVKKKKYKPTDKL
ncbi:MAG: YHS domain-containing protein [Bacteroidetes bacterium]|nr:YHS domain-containing protein [Bacteroidota bacterium]